MSHQKLLVFLVLLFSRNIAQGLFLDQLMTDCHGLPFACMQQNHHEAGEPSRQRTMYPNAKSLPQSGPMPNSLIRQHTIMMAKKGGYNPSDMSRVVEQSNTGRVLGYVNNGEYTTHIQQIHGWNSQRNQMTGETNKAGNLEAMLLKMLSDFCDMKWLQCPEDCSLVKGSTGCPLCSCPEQDQALYENQKVHERRRCSPVSGGCPENCVVFDEFFCTVCLCEEVRKNSRKVSIATWARQNRPNETSWYDKVWSS